MNVDTMRSVDYWLGIPLCFFSTLWLKLVRAVCRLVSCERARGRNVAGGPRKILCIELSEMGSAIVAYPALSLLKKKYPHAELYFLIFSKNRESVDVLGIVPHDHVLTIECDSLPQFLRSLIGRLFQLYRLKFDTCIDFELFSRCTALISFLSGAPERIGFTNYTNEGLYRGDLITHPVIYNPHQHMALNFLALVASSGAEEEYPLMKRSMQKHLIPLPRVTVEGEEQDRWKERLQKDFKVSFAADRLVLLNPDPGLLALRGWPVDRYAALAKCLCEADSSIKIGVIGLPKSRRLAEAVLTDVPADRQLILTGETKTLRDLLVLFHLARLLVSNDSGPAHFAALTGLHGVILFGPETPKLYAPLSDRIESLSADLSCSPCYSAANHRYSPCRSNRCLQEISVERVFDRCMRLLSVSL